MKQETTIGARLRTIMEEQGLGYEQLGERTAAKAREVSKLLGFLGKL